MAYQTSRGDLVHRLDRSSVGSSRTFKGEDVRPPNNNNHDLTGILEAVFSTSEATDLGEINWVSLFHLYLHFLLLVF